MSKTQTASKVNRKPYRAFNDIYTQLDKEGFGEEQIAAAIACCMAGKRTFGAKQVRERLSSPAPVTAPPETVPNACASSPPQQVLPWRNSAQVPAPLSDVEIRCNALAARAAQEQDSLAYQWHEQMRRRILPL